MSDVTEQRPAEEARQEFVEAFGAVTADSTDRPKVRKRMIAVVGLVAVAAGTAVGIGALTGSTKPVASAKNSKANTAAKTAAAKASHSHGGAIPTGSHSAGSPGSGASTGSASASQGTSTGAGTGKQTSNAVARSTSGQRLSVSLNSGGQAVVFALSSAGTAIYDTQRSGGSGAWSGFGPVPGSPANLASAPAAVADANGHLELFARNTAGQLIDGWQTSPSGSGWTWDTAVTGGPVPGTLVGDPTAILRPDGKVEVFIRLGNGAVATTTQADANGTSGWSGWSVLGGSVAGTPIPFITSGKQLELFARSTSGALVTDVLNGAWSGWSTVGASPANLSGDPAPVSNADGVTEVFSTTGSGNVDHVWLYDGAWTWGVPLAADSLGSNLVGSPTVLRWSDGHLEVFARLAGGEMAHAWQNNADGTSGWSGWGPVGGSIAGDPTALRSQGGVPEVVALGTGSQAVRGYWDGTAWSSWASLGGGF